MKKFVYIIIGIFLVGFQQCKKNKTVDKSVEIANEILYDFPSKVLIPNLYQLNQEAKNLLSSVEIFVNKSDESNLNTAQNAWLKTRVEWEKSEACLFGPVSTLNLDPAIDSWPVNFVEIDSVIKGSISFSDTYIDNLANTLKGFHCIEYMLFGKSKSRKASDLTTKQKDYLVAVTKHLNRITFQMHHEWIETGNNFSQNITLAGTKYSIYKTKREALLEITKAMSEIIAEVGLSKIDAPFAAQDSTLEESPFALNSWQDFKNNILGARNVYTSSSHNGVQKFVTEYNKSLDATILQNFDICLKSIDSFKEPFGRSIYSQPAAVQSLQSQLSALRYNLESELVRLIEAKIIE